MGLTPNANIRKIVNGQRVDAVSIEEGSNNFVPPKNVDAITVEYPDTVTEVYRYREGGTSGSIIKSVTIIYSSSSKKDLVSVVVV